MTRDEIIQNKANLSGADLSGAYLRLANLSEADLSEADLSGADLSWANLSEANLWKANLSEADLSGADLSEADLRLANLSEANLTHVDARNLRLNEDKEILFRMDCCIWPVTVFHGIVHIGCQEFSFDGILNMTEEKAETIHEGAGKRWKRWGNTLKSAILDIQKSGI